MNNINMASSLRVESVQFLEQSRINGSCSSQCLMPKKIGVVKYNIGHHYELHRRPCLRARAHHNALVNTTNSCSRSSSSSSLLDLYCDGSQSQSSAYSSDGIWSKKKRVVDKEEDVCGKLDRWVKDSVVEIVSNLDEAPFLVHVYSDGEGGSASTGNTRLISEKAAAESWPSIKGRWGGDNPTPSGIILVEEMESGEEAGGDGQVLGESDNKKSCSSSTKVWGILIQGKGFSCPACYILKTSRVRSVLGCCTHFCLSRVECFFETVDIQLKKLWLV